jgi:hypothetical protein
MNELITKQSSRLLFSILTPGFFGIFPYALILYCNFNFCKNNWDSSLVLFVLFFFSLAFGLIFHLLGVKLELQIDRILTCCYCKKFDQVWEDYLSLELDKIENLRRKYMSFLIDRYQFQLNMCPASISAIIGFSYFLHLLNWSPWHITCFALVGFALVVLLLFHSYQVGKLLHDNRKSLLADARRNRFKRYRPRYHN